MSCYKEKQTEQKGEYNGSQVNNNKGINNDKIENDNQMTESTKAYSDNKNEETKEVGNNESINNLQKDTDNPKKDTDSLKKDTESCEADVSSTAEQDVPMMCSICYLLQDDNGCNMGKEELNYLLGFTLNRIKIWVIITNIIEKNILYT